MLADPPRVLPGAPPSVVDLTAERLPAAGAPARNGTADGAAPRGAPLPAAAAAGGGARVSQTSAPCSAAAMSAAPPGPQGGGTAVTIAASALTCPSPTFEYWVLAPNATAWMSLAGYTAAASAVWQTAGLAGGTYTLAIWARNAGSTASYEAYAELSYMLSPSPGSLCLDATLATNPLPPVQTNTPVTLTATATGCQSPLYEFWVLPPGGQWSTINGTSYRNTATIRWTPTATGSYTLEVWVKATASGGLLDTYAATSFVAGTSSATCASATLSVAPASPQPPSTLVNLSATGGGTGCQNPLYEFWLLPSTPGANWQLVSGSSCVEYDPTIGPDYYNSASTVTWTTTDNPCQSNQPFAAGSYTLVVWVRDAGSTAAYDSYYEPPAYVLGTPSTCMGAGLAVSPASPLAAGTATVTLTASVTGCSAPQYQFWVLPPGGAWVLEQAYPANGASLSPSFAWPTLGLTPGSYMLAVWVRDAGATIAYQAYATLSYDLTVPCGQPTLTVSPASPQSVGTSVTLTATVSGCATPQFAFWEAPVGATSWTSVLDPNQGPTATWSTAGLGATEYTLALTAKDVTSQAPYDTAVSLSDTLVAAGVCTVSITASQPPSYELTASNIYQNFFDGNSVTFTAMTSSGCGSGLSYQFQYRPAVNPPLPHKQYGFTIAQNWSSTSTWLWTPPYEPNATPPVTDGWDTTLWGPDPGTSAESYYIAAFVSADDGQTTLGSGQLTYLVSDGTCSGNDTNNGNNNLGGTEVAGAPYPYPTHQQITATVFWIGEPRTVSDGCVDQSVSIFDDTWATDYGGYDDPYSRIPIVQGSQVVGSLPIGFTPQTNPFYLDLPYVDITGSNAPQPDATLVYPTWILSSAQRAAQASGQGASLLRDRWVEVTYNPGTGGSVTCYGQYEDAGPGPTDNVTYVFGTDRPAEENLVRKSQYNGAGMDVSPALRDCLLQQVNRSWIDNADDFAGKITWQFVDASQVQPGPWLPAPGVWGYPAP